MAQAGELVPSSRVPWGDRRVVKEASTTETWFCTKPEIVFYFFKTLVQVALDLMDSIQE